MNIIVIALGSTADVHPLLGVATTLVGRGHHVNVLANPVFQPLVQRCGAEFVPVGTIGSYVQAMRDPQLWHPKTSLRRLWALVSGQLRQVFDLVSARLDSHTVIIGSPWAFSGRLAQEKFGVPYVSMQTSASNILSAHAPPVHHGRRLPGQWPSVMRSGTLFLAERLVLDRLMGPELNAVRRDLGLPAIKRILGRWSHSPDGVVGLFPDWFAPPQKDWPSDLHLTGFPLFDIGDHRPMDDELMSFLNRGDAPVIITPGSNTSDVHAFVAASLAAAAQAGRRAVLLGVGPEDRSGLPNQVLARRCVPLRSLLPHAAAVVHHAGIGMSALALAAGVPQLVAPSAHDQFDNAERLLRLGVAKCWQRSCGPAPLGRSLHALCSDDAVRQRCAVLRGLVDAPQRACGRAADAVERIANARAFQRTRPFPMQASPATA